MAAVKAALRPRNANRQAKIGPEGIAWRLKARTQRTFRNDKDPVIGRLPLVHLPHYNRRHCRRAGIDGAVGR
jgi:hypothetical protein